jgi:hypothetical protein
MCTHTHGSIWRKKSSWLSNNVLVYTKVHVELICICMYLCVLQPTRAAFSLSTRWKRKSPWVNLVINHMHTRRVMKDVSVLLFVWRWWCTEMNELKYYLVFLQPCVQQVWISPAILLWRICQYYLLQFSSTRHGFIIFPFSYTS